MDYLLSLVGKDQDTIVDAIKDLAENSEKVKLQEKEINNLKSEIDDAKEEIHYLRNKLDQKYDLIEEHEIDKTESDEQVKSAKNELEYQKNVLGNKDRMRLEVEEKCSKLEDDLFIQNGVIEKFKDELVEKSDAVTHEEELLQLSSEVETLKDVNEKKEMEYL
jgi:chromosome segregation ATPase